MKIINRLLDSRITSLIARIVATFIYWWTAIERITDWPKSVSSMAEHGLQPAAAFSAAVLATQVVAPALIIWGPLAWLGSGWLVIFSMIALSIVHPFWEGGPRAAMQMHNAIIICSLCGGLVLCAIVRRLEARLDQAGLAPGARGGD